MAQSKSRSAPETENLANELAALREDFGALARDLKSLAQARGESLSDKTAERVVALKAAGERQVAKAGELAGKATREAEGYVREHPAATVAASAVLGFVIGAIAARR
jgi:ElaB/YqjD/DUF883 family membrane-anchored ribosome-binding protein